MYRVSKTYGHHLGLSCVFRQWKATSHCRFLHGYAISVKLNFASPRLNENGWCIDFGSLRPVKAWLEATFDHKTLVAEDDPMLQWFRDSTAIDGMLDLVIVPKVGMEGFAELIYDNTYRILSGKATIGALQGGSDNGVYLESVEVREHDANGVIYSPEVCRTIEGGYSCG